MSNWISITPNHFQADHENEVHSGEFNARLISYIVYHLLPLNGFLRVSRWNRWTKPIMFDCKFCLYFVQLMFTKGKNNFNLIFYSLIWILRWLNYDSFAQLYFRLRSHSTISGSVNSVGWLSKLWLCTFRWWRCLVNISVTKSWNTAWRDGCFLSSFP